MAIRAVLDTNVILAAWGATNPGGPNIEILDRWQHGEFQFLYSEGIALEYAEKLLEFSAAYEDARLLLRTLEQLGERVEIEFYHLQKYPPDPDDIAFVLCASNGSATHLVTYDKHLLQFQTDLPFRICEPLAFLADLRMA